jgi:hypothetical protein
MEMDSTYASLISDAVNVNIVDKCTRRKSITRSSDFLWED